MTNVQLKPCPFCGGEASTHICGSEAYEIGSPRRHIVARWVSCDSCGASGSSTFDMDEAIKAWNIRVSNG